MRAAHQGGKAQLLAALIAPEVTVVASLADWVIGHAANVLTTVSARRRADSSKLFKALALRIILIKRRNARSRFIERAFFLKLIRRLPTLPRSFPRSTIGSKRLNFRVRDGNGCDPLDKITGKLERACKRAWTIE